MVEIPRLQVSIPIVDQQGRPSGMYNRFWRKAMETIEQAVDDIGQNVSDLAQAQLDIVAAQAAADAAQDDAIQALSDAAAASGNITAHILAADPHPQYQTQTEGDARYVRQDLGASWTAPTGTASRAGFATYSAPTVSNPPTQSEVQDIADHVQILSRAVKALIDDLKSNGALT